MFALPCRLVRSSRRSGIAAALCAGLALAGLACPPSLGADSPFDQGHFRREIAPILIGRCLECHSGEEPKGGLDLSRRDGALAGGNSGPVLELGDPELSLLVEYVRDGTMPPKQPLSEDDVRALSAWVRAGASWPDGLILSKYQFTTDARAGLDWWSLQSIASPTIPQVRTADRVATPVDAFVLAKLREHDLQFAPEADRRTLIRRATYDLTGLPPTPAEVEAFLADRSPDAYRRLVDRLLASRHYGERWGRHWLDVVRYSESKGFERDRLRENAWRYRDWVIQAFNDDMPYDRFVREQLAGDAVAPHDPAAAVATGFLVTGPNNDVGNRSELELKRERADELDDFVTVTGAAFLGLTVGCARCHDHKFDPIPTRDYYNLVACLSGVRYGDRVIAPADQQQEHEQKVAELDARIKMLGEQIAALEEQIEQQGDSTPEETEKLKQQREKIAAQKKSAEDQKRALPELPTAWAAVSEKPDPVHVLKRGDVRSQGAEAGPAALSAVATLPAELSITAGAGDSQRRLALGDWITSPANPLTARVMVNRIWHYHFGTGIVDTPSDFGFNGGRPSHPELLDWLAAEFIRRGWSIKAMHRLIMLSSAYRQAWRRDAAAENVDAANRLLWRMNRRRLSAEALRDSILATSGKLDPTMGGPGYRIFNYIDGNIPVYEPLSANDPAQWRRTVYRHAVRSHSSPFLDVFDCPDSSVMVPRRARTTTPMQALSLLNNEFVVLQAEHFAQRLREEADDDPAGWVTRAFWLVLSRPPKLHERSRCVEFVRQHGLENLGRVLWNTNEFLYVN